MSSHVSITPEWIAQYDALVRHAALVDLGNRTQIEIAGADRAAFLHNLCTNEVRKLVSGAGREAFLTTVQGKTLAHVFVFVGPESIVVSTAPGQDEKILKHLDRYLVSEQVTLADRSQEWSELFLGGRESRRLLATLAAAMVPDERLSHVGTVIAGRTVWMRRADMAGPDGFLISLHSGDADAVRQALVDAGAMACCSDAFEAARIEWGFPLFGVDISDSNLPQEVGRDALAISFTKGCYLGQETVARIDALGHVNKTLVGIAFGGAARVTPGLELTAAGQSVGHVTSASYSPRLGAPLALGYARRGYNAPGTRLDSHPGAADVKVIALPLS